MPATLNFFQSGGIKDNGYVRCYMSNLEMKRDDYGNHGLNENIILNHHGLGYYIKHAIW